jgi:hypothetical protein
LGQGPARDATLALVVDVDREAGLPEEAALLRDAIHEFFRHRAERYRQRLRELFRVGGTSLVIGLIALAAAIALADFLATLMKGSVSGKFCARASRSAAGSPCGVPLRCSCATGGRFAMKLDSRIGLRPCQCGLGTISATGPDAWRADWPAVSPRGEERGKGGTVDRAS